MADKKPFVKIACLCERILTENDGVLTLVRVVDQFSIRPLPPKVLEMGATPQLELTLVVALSGEGIVGQHDLGIRLVGPSQTQPVKNLPIEFPPGPLSAVTGVVNVQIGAVKNYGESRFEILFDGELLTVVPFRLLEATESSVPTAETGQQS